MNVMDSCVFHIKHGITIGRVEKLIGFRIMMAFNVMLYYNALNSLHIGYGFDASFDYSVKA